MSTACSKSVTIYPVDMPLDQAVFGTSTVAGGSFIWAVRGGYIFKCDTNGNKILARRYTNGPCFGEASIAFDDVGDRLYVSFWNDGLNLGDSIPTNVAKGIWTINPNTLVSSFTDINPTLGLAAATTSMSGPHQIICNNGTLMGTVFTSPVYTKRLGVFQLNVPGLTLGQYRVYGDTNDAWFDVCWDVNLTALWYTGVEFPGVYGRIFATSSDVSTQNMGAAVPQGPTGICQISSVPYWLYATSRSTTLIKFASANLGAFSTFNMSTGFPAIATARPYRCRFNTVDSLIYIPDPVTNSVIIWNPASDTVSSIKTGFDTPFDVVFTATKKFAVQQGSVGLKEIT